MNYLSCKIDIVKSLANTLVECMGNCNIAEKDYKNLAHLLKNRINDVKFRYEEIVREFNI